MATIQKDNVYIIAKDRVQKILDELTSGKKIYHDPEYKYKNMITGGMGMGDTNHCKLDSGGLSGCDATKIKKTSEKHTCQKKCKYYKKASRSARCIFETFGEYCWSTEAQDDNKSG